MDYKSVEGRSVCHTDCTSASVCATVARYYKICSPHERNVIFIAGFRSIRGWHGARRGRPPPAPALVDAFEIYVFTPFSPPSRVFWGVLRIYTLFAPLFRFGTTILAKRFERLFFSFSRDIGGVESVGRDFANNLLQWRMVTWQEWNLFTNEQYFSKFNKQNFSNS